MCGLQTLLNDIDKNKIGPLVFRSAEMPITNSEHAAHPTWRSNDRCRDGKWLIPLRYD